MNKSLSILLRYLFILFAGLGNLWIFYKIFTPLTANFVRIILNLFSPAILIGSKIIFRSAIIHIIPACIAGSAYYLLFILIMSTPKISPKKRALLILSSFSLLLAFNTIRILFLIFITNSAHFASIHLFIWYFISTLFVIMAWLFTSKAFKIESIPVYSDLEYLISKTKKFPSNRKTQKHLHKLKSTKNKNAQ